MSAKKSLSYKQLQKNRWFLIAITLGLVILVVAIFLELIRSQMASQVDPKLKKYAIPLAPTFKEDVFQKLDTFTYLSPQEVRAEVERLPIRVIDRETKQIVTLQEKQTSVSTVSAQESATGDEDSSQPVSADSGLGNDAAAEDEPIINDVLFPDDTSDDINQENPDVPQDGGILPE